MAARALGKDDNKEKGEGSAGRQYGKSLYRFSGNLNFLFISMVSHGFVRWREKQTKLLLWILAAPLEVDFFGLFRLTQQKN